FQKLSGHAAIGHVRYATQGERTIDNVQPLLFRSQTGGMALAHNGNIMNAYELRGELEAAGSILQTSSDTEVLAHLLKRNGKMDVISGLKDALSKLIGAYAFVLLMENSMHIALDPRGLRPLSIGRLGES